MLTILIPSSFWRNSNAKVTFSSFCDLIFGLLLYLINLLPLSTSTRAMKRRPSDKSVSKSATCLLTVLRCSFVQRVKVFFWIIFHWASPAKSLSAGSLGVWPSPRISCECLLVVICFEIWNCNCETRRQLFGEQAYKRCCVGDRPPPFIQYVPTYAWGA